MMKKKSGKPPAKKKVELENFIQDDLPPPSPVENIQKKAVT